MGSVHSYEIAAGKRYRVLYRKPDNSQGQKRGFKTKRDAELHLANIEVAKSRGEYIDTLAARATLGDLGIEWLANQSHLQPSTYRVQESAWRVHVAPKWGSRAVGSIRHTEVQAWVKSLTDSHSPTTVKRCHGVLAGILDNAVLDRRLNANPARKIKLPRKVSKRHSYLTHRQVTLLAEQAGRHGALVLFMAYTGMRWGEVTALRLHDVNPLKRRATITDNAVAVGSDIVVGRPKSHVTRSLNYPEFLGPHVAEQFEGKGRDELLFGDGQAYLRLPHSVSGWFYGAVKRSRAIDPAFPVLTPHDLRHTAASLAISAGANVKAVQRMLGHASAAMTLDTYADLFDDDLDGVAVALNEHRLASLVAI